MAPVLLDESGDVTGPALRRLGPAHRLPGRPAGPARWPGWSAGTTGRARPRAASSSGAGTALAWGHERPALHQADRARAHAELRVPHRRPRDAECVVVDPAWEIDAILERRPPTTCGSAACSSPTPIRTTWAATSSATISPAWRSCSRSTPAKVYVHKAEREFLRGLRLGRGEGRRRRHAPVGSVPLTFIHTPGHTPGLPVLPRGRPPRLRRHAVHPLVRPHRSARQRSAEMYTSLTQRLGALPDDDRGAARATTTAARTPPSATRSARTR